jgi:hypothetical protein
MRKSKDEIVAELEESFQELSSLCNTVDEGKFNSSVADKWTPAENFQHLITATRMTSLAFSLPKIMPRLLYGKPKRTSHGFSKVVDNYQRKLNHGAKASGAYVPRKTNYEKSKLHQKLNSEGKRLIRAIAEKWSDEQLDAFQVAHPILGLLTLRELAYFTLYHNSHHADTVKKHYLQPGQSG